MAVGDLPFRKWSVIVLVCKETFDLPFFFFHSIIGLPIFALKVRPNTQSSPTVMHLNYKSYGVGMDRRACYRDPWIRRWERKLIFYRQIWKYSRFSEFFRILVSEIWFVFMHIAEMYLQCSQQSHYPIITSGLTLLFGVSNIIIPNHWQNQLYLPIPVEFNRIILLL